MGRRALVVGTGAIGTAVATRLDALGVQVIGVRRRAIAGETLPGISEMYPADRMLEAAAAVDVVVAAVPGSPATADMFDQRFFEAMRAGSVFINVGRGVSVDEAALIDALASGHLRAAAIDVAKREPLPADDPLWDAPNLFISPHSSGAGSGYMDRMWDLFCDNLERFRSGRPLLNVVDVHTEYG
jgi:phosphoglycerate dehydrogenase-like enzyme